jgi:hypothetical protein
LTILGFVLVFVKLQHSSIFCRLNGVDMDWGGKFPAKGLFGSAPTLQPSSRSGRSGGERFNFTAPEEWSGGSCSSLLQSCQTRAPSAPREIVELAEQLTSEQVLSQNSPNSSIHLGSGLTQQDVIEESDWIKLELLSLVIVGSNLD